MKIYKVRAWVNQNIKGRIEHPFQREEVFLKKKTALAFYKEMVSEIKTWDTISKKYEGFVQCFIPHIFKDGSLAYWPDGDKYIAKYPI